MSETTTEAAPNDAAPADQSTPVDYQPSHVLSSEQGDNPEAPGSEAPAPEPAEKPERSPEQQKADNEARRLANLTRQRYAEKARADAAEARARELADRLHRLENNGQAPPQDMERAVQTRAEQIIAQREAQSRVTAFHEAGAAAYGDWQQRCQDLQEMGADPQFAELLIELPDGARVAGALAEDPRELERIAGIRTERGRAIALARYGAALESKAAAPPAAPARAPLPAPIKPLAGPRANPQPDPERGSMSDYEKWSSSVNWSR